MEDQLIYILLPFAVVLWIWALIDLFKSKFKVPVSKLMWLIIIISFPVLGSVAYFQLKKKFLDQKSSIFHPYFRRRKV